MGLKEVIIHLGKKAGDLQLLYKSPWYYVVS